MFYLFFFFLIIPAPPISTLFPYTTLFRSLEDERIKFDMIIFFYNEIERYDSSREYFRKKGIEFLAGIDKLKIVPLDRKSTRLNSSHVRNSYAVFCLKKKKKDHRNAEAMHH